MGTIKSCFSHWGVLVGPWTMQFSETSCQFHSIEGEITMSCCAGLASREPARPGQAGLNAHEGPWGTYISRPTRHGQPLVHGPAASGHGINGQCGVLQHTPDTGRPMTMANVAPIGAGGPPWLFQLPLGHIAPALPGRAGSLGAKAAKHVSCGIFQWLIYG